MVSHNPKPNVVGRLRVAFPAYFLIRPVPYERIERLGLVAVSTGISPRRERLPDLVVRFARLTRLGSCGMISPPFCFVVWIIGKESIQILWNRLRNWLVCG